MEVSTMIEAEATAFRPIEQVVTPKELTLLRRHSSVEGRKPKSFSTELSQDTPYHKGDYQAIIDEGMLGKENTVNIVKEIQRYTEELLGMGIEPVTIVDYGAATAKTSLEAAEKIKPLVKAGRVKYIATEFFAIPTQQDVAELAGNPHTYIEDFGYPEYQLEPEHIRLLQQALKEGTITFLRAGGVELYEALGENKAHLMFWMNMPQPEYADVQLKLISEMLDSNYGTLVICKSEPLKHKLFLADIFDKDMPERKDLTYEEVLQAGLNSLAEKGFKEGAIIHEDIYKTGIDKHTVVYQAPKAPKFFLYNSPERRRLISASKPNPLQRFFPRFLRR